MGCRVFITVMAYSCRLLRVCYAWRLTSADFKHVVPCLHTIPHSFVLGIAESIRYRGKAIHGFSPCLDQARTMPYKDYAASMVFDIGARSLMCCHGVGLLADGDV